VNHTGYQYARPGRRQICHKGRSGRSSPVSLLCPNLDQIAPTGTKALEISQHTLKTHQPTRPAQHLVPPTRGHWVLCIHLWSLVVLESSLNSRRKDMMPCEPALGPIRTTNEKTSICLVQLHRATEAKRRLKKITGSVVSSFSDQKSLRVGATTISQRIDFCRSGFWERENEKAGGGIDITTR
jgi:hypothetical protein